MENIFFPVAEKVTENIQEKAEQFKTKAREELEKLHINNLEDFKALPVDIQKNTLKRLGCSDFFVDMSDDLSIELHKINTILDSTLFNEPTKVEGVFEYDLFNLPSDIEEELQLEFSGGFIKDRETLKKYLENLSDWFGLKSSEKRKILREMNYEDFYIYLADKELNSAYVDKLSLIDRFVYLANKSSSRKYRAYLREHGVHNTEEWKIKTLEEKEEILKGMGFGGIQSDEDIEKMEETWRVTAIRTEKELDDRFVHIISNYLKMPSNKED